jgi:NAD+ synthase (glutamine-hydrolysing)
MKLVKVAAAVLNQTPLAWEPNKANILGAIEEARRQEASVLCLPELALSGYGCEDEFHSRSVHDTAAELLGEIVPATRGMIVCLGLPLLHNNALFNAACLAVDGRIAGFGAKRFLAGDGLHYEPRWFKPWPHDQVSQVTVLGGRYPLGDLYFDCGGVRLGFEICEDAWVAQRPGGALSRKGVDLILNPSASHFAFGKMAVRERFVMEGSRAFGVSYVYSNLLGNEAGRAIYDGGAMIASAGQMLAVGPRFSYAPFQVTSALVDVDATRMTQARTGSFQPEIDHDPADCVKLEFAFPEFEPVDERPSQAAWESGPRLKEEEFTRAVALGLFDYLRKSHARGFVVSLSGGTDSTAVSALVALMARLGAAELGLPGFLETLAHIPALRDAGDVRETVRRLLLCAYQGTKNSSQRTREAARQVSAALGADYLELEIEPLVEQYVGMISGAIGRELTWEQDDLALQNIQARVRGPGIWLLANLRNALLLATSNRSEAAAGYATMDGDTCGGLSPIAGIDKAYLRQWLRWLELEGPEGVGPIPELAAVTSQSPTPELRPPEAAQRSEEDLMPMPLLDRVERAAIRDKLPPVDVFRRMRVEFPQYELRQLALWVERFFRLWCRNQWKRERYAPSFHLDDENLDPKTWCRFPILSGGFERELAALRAHLAKLEG